MPSLFEAAENKQKFRTNKSEIQGSFTSFRMTTVLGEFTEEERNAMDDYAYVYILANGFKKLYIGITTELEFRVNNISRRRTQTATPQDITFTASSTSSASPLLLRQSPARSN